MNILSYLKINVTLVLMFFIPMYIYGVHPVKIIKQETNQKTDTLLQIKNSNIENAMGEKFYAKWRKLNNTADFDSAQTHFVNAFKLLPPSLKQQYSLEKGRLYFKNKEDGVLMKDWYEQSIYYFKINSPFEVDLVLKKYAIVEESVKAYGRVYGYCDDALEILQNHKGDLDFYFIQKNKSEKKYLDLMHHLQLEERFLIFDCNIKK